MSKMMQDYRTVIQPGVTDAQIVAALASKYPTVRRAAIEVHSARISVKRLMTIAEEDTSSEVREAAITSGVLPLRDAMVLASGNPRLEIGVLSAMRGVSQDDVQFVLTCLAEVCRVPYASVAILT